MRTTSTTHSSTPDSGSWNRLPSADSRTATLSGLTTLAILTVAFGAMALGIPYFWVVFPVGFGGVLPLVLACSRRDRPASEETGARPLARELAAAGQTTSESTRDEALRTLRTRYARGELTDAAFEHRLERLLETETVGEATAWTRRTAVGNEDSGDGEGGVHDEGSEGDTHHERTGSE